MAACPDAYRVPERVREVFAMGGTALSNDESAYLSMHIARLAARECRSGDEGLAQAG